MQLLTVEESANLIIEKSRGRLTRSNFSFLNDDPRGIIRLDISGESYYYLGIHHVLSQLDNTDVTINLDSTISPEVYKGSLKKVLETDPDSKYISEIIYCNYLTNFIVFKGTNNEVISYSSFESLNNNIIKCRRENSYNATSFKHLEPINKLELINPNTLLKEYANYSKHIKFLYLDMLTSKVVFQNKVTNKVTALNERLYKDKLIRYINLKPATIKAHSDADNSHYTPVPEDNPDLALYYLKRLNVNGNISKFISIDPVSKELEVENKLGKYVKVENYHVLMLNMICKMSLPMYNILAPEGSIKRPIGDRIREIDTEGLVLTVYPSTNKPNYQCKIKVKGYKNLFSISSIRQARLILKSLYEDKLINYKYTSDAISSFYIDLPLSTNAGRLEIVDKKLKHVANSTGINYVINKFSDISQNLLVTFPDLKVKIKYRNLNSFEEILYAGKVSIPSEAKRLLSNDVISFVNTIDANNNYYTLTFKSGETKKVNINTIRKMTDDEINNVNNEKEFLDLIDKYIVGSKKYFTGQDVINEVNRLDKFKSITSINSVDIEKKLINVSLERTPDVEMNFHTLFKRLKVLTKRIKSIHTMDEIKSNDPTKFQSNVEDIDTHKKIKSINQVSKVDNKIIFVVEFNYDPGIEYTVSYRSLLNTLPNPDHKYHDKSGVIKRRPIN